MVYLYSIRKQYKEIQMLEMIKQYMDMKNINKYELSKRAGLPHNIIYDVFNGKRPASAHRINQFLDALNLEAITTLKEKDNA